MKIHLGKRYIFLSSKELLKLVSFPVVLSLIILFLVNLKPIYKVETKLAYSGSSIGKIQKGSLKNLPRALRRYTRLSHGLSAANSAMNFQQKLALLSSDDLYVSYITEYNLKPLIYPNRWDEKNKQWKVRQPNIISNLLNFIQDNEFSETKKNAEPKDYKALKILSKKIKIKAEKQTGLINVQLKWENPIDGEKILRNFVDFANNYIIAKERKSIIGEIKATDKLLLTAKTTEAEKYLLQHKEQLITKLMVENSQHVKTFTVVIPPRAPVESSFKFPIVLLIIIFFLSTILAFIYISQQREPLPKKEKLNKLVLQKQS